MRLVSYVGVEQLCACVCGGAHTCERFMCISGVGLVSRPSQHPVFDCLQYAKKKKKTEGGGLVHFIM